MVRDLLLDNDIDAINFRSIKVENNEKLPTHLSEKQIIRSKKKGLKY